MTSEFAKVHQIHPLGQHLDSTTDLKGQPYSMLQDKKLEDKGFLMVNKDETDKRVKRVQLTKMGKEKKTIAEEVPAQMLCKLKGMSAEESRELVKLLDKLGGCFQNAEL